MAGKRTAVVAVTVALTVALTVAPGFAAGATQGQQQGHLVKGEPDIDVSIPDDQLASGETTSFEVVLYNEGNLTQGSRTNPELESRVTAARAVRVNVTDDGMPFTVETNEQFVTSLPEDKSAPIAFQVSVDSNADPGTYTVPVGIKYNYTDRINTRTGEENVTSDSQFIDVELTIEDIARFQVVNVSSNARVGATGTVAVTMRNTGSERARNATVSLTSQNADLTFGQTSSASRYAGQTWLPGETRTVDYRVTAAPSASQQSYTFAAQVSFEDAQGIQIRSESLSFGVVPEREQDFSIVGVRSDLAVDDDATVAVTLRNEGPLTVSEAGVTITSTSSDVVFGQSASASQYVGRWRPGTTRTVRVEATATPGAEPRNYSFDAQVSFEDREGDPGKAGPLQFGLSPAPERNPEFEVRNVSSSLRVGREGTLRGTIANVGGEPASELVVVLEPTNQNLEPLETEYSVGRISAGGSASFAFDLEVSDAAEAGPKRFRIHTEYRDEDDDTVKSESIDLRQRVRGSRNTFGVRARNVTVERGGTQTVRVRVRNNDDETLTDISAQVFADDPFDIGDSEAFIARLEPGESDVVQFEVSAGSGALVHKTYPVEMDFQYDDADGDTLLSDTYRVPVSVAEAESEGGLPLPVLVGVVVVVAVVAVLGYRRYS